MKLIIWIIILVCVGAYLWSQQRQENFTANSPEGTLIREVFHSEEIYPFKNSYREMLRPGVVLEQEAGPQLMMRVGLGPRFHKLATYSYVVGDPHFQVDPNADTRSAESGVPVILAQIKEKQTQIRIWLENIEAILTTPRYLDKMHNYDPAHPEKEIDPSIQGYLGRHITQLKKGKETTVGAFMHLFETHEVLHPDGTTTLRGPLQRLNCAGEKVRFTLNDLIAHLCIFHEGETASPTITYQDGAVVPIYDQVASIIHYYTGIDVLALNPTDETFKLTPRNPKIYSRKISFPVQKVMKEEELDLDDSLDRISNAIQQLDTMLENSANELNLKMIGNYVEGLFGVGCDEPETTP